MIITIRDLIGEDCITIEDGQRVYDAIHQELLAHTDTELDFEGVEFFASPFFNSAIGQLLKDLSPEDLNDHLTFSHLLPSARNILKRVIANAKRYYADPTYRKAVHKVIEEITEAQ